MNLDSEWKRNVKFQLNRINNYGIPLNYNSIVILHLQSEYEHKIVGVNGVIHKFHEFHKYFHLN